MAIPSYFTDLRLVASGNTITGDPGTWAELSGHISGGAQTQETDYYIQGSSCISQSTGGKTGTVVGLQYDYGSNLVWNTGYCIFTWMIFTAANAVDTWSAGGIRLGIGSTTGNVRYWNAIGSDFGKYPYGGWQNIAVDPVTWWSTPDGTDDGTPTAGNYRIIASLPNMISAVSKGNPHAVDTIRYGRGEIQISGGSLSDGYCNFTGIVTLNDDQLNRWGLFQKEGTGYLWKGLLSFGSGTTTKICNFVDANKNITIDNTPRTYTNFNRIEISNTGSTISWSAINFSALSATQLSRGSLYMLHNASLTLDTCVFTDMDTFNFMPRATITNCTFRRCLLVTQSGSTITNSFFANSTGTTSLLSNDLSKISYTNFLSDGQNHAIEINVAGTYNFIGNTFDNYATVSGTTGNEAIYNTSGGLVTINVSESTDSPSYRNGVGSTTVVNNNVAVTFTGLKDNTEVRVFAAGTTTELAGIENATDGTTNNRSFTFSLAVSTNIDYRIHNIGYVIIEVYGYVMPSSSTSLPIQQQTDRWII